MKVEVIRRKVNPGDFEKLQDDVVVLEKDIAAKQVVIDKLQSDVAAQEQRIVDLETP